MRHSKSKGGKNTANAAVGVACAVPSSNTERVTCLLVCQYVVDMDSVRYGCSPGHKQRMNRRVLTVETKEMKYKTKK